MRVLVCGGRNYTDRIYFNVWMDQIDAEYGITEIIEGGAKGADLLANHWAEDRGIPCSTYRADWDTHGKAAGMIRNNTMLIKGEPDLIVAFPGGSGTEGMKNLGRRAGVKVIEL